MIERSGTEHSHWALWSTWRRGPDVVTHIAKVVADETGSPATVEVHVRDDVECATTDDDLETVITANALKRFRALLIENGTQELKVRIAFVRKRADVLIGARDPRLASIKHGVVLEVSSTNPSHGDKVEEVKRSLAGAIERGRPRWITRVARHGKARRAQAPPGVPAWQGGSASRLLERRLRSWPGPTAFPAIFTVMSLAAYAGLISVLANWDIVYADKTLALEKDYVKAIVAGVGVAVAGIALVAQRWLFPAVEVSILPNASRATRTLLSSVTIPTAIGFLLGIPGFDGLFSRT